MPVKRPVPVLVIAILHFVFGGFGLLAGICGGAFQAAGGAQMISNLTPKPPPGQQPSIDQGEMEKFIEQRVPSHKPVQYGGIGLDLGICTLMILSGIGLLKVKSWGRYSSIAYGFLSIIRTIALTVYAAAFTIPAMSEYFAQAPFKNQQEKQVMEFAVNIAKVTPFLTLLRMIYPIIVLIIMFLPSVKAAFRGQAADAGTHGGDEGDYRDPDTRFRAGDR